VNRRILEGVALTLTVALAIYLFASSDRGATRGAIEIGQLHQNLIKEAEELGVTFFDMGEDWQLWLCISHTTSRMHDRIREAEIPSDLHAYQPYWEQLVSRCTGSYGPRHAVEGVRQAAMTRMRAALDYADETHEVWASYGNPVEWKNIMLGDIYQISDTAAVLLGWPSIEEELQGVPDSLKEMIYGEEE
jgi:hypothetical protein